MPTKQGLQRNLNFKAEPALRAYKIIAAERGMPMKELMEASFRVWIDKESDASVEPLLPTDWNKSYVCADGRVVRPASGD